MTPLRLRTRPAVVVTLSLFLPALDLAAQARPATDSTRARVLDTMRVVGRSDDLIGRAASRTR